MVTSGELESQKSTYKVPGIIEFVVPKSHEGVVDSEGYAMKVSYCIIWQRALEEVGSEYADLTACEFLLTHNLLKHNGNTCSFRLI